MLVQRLTLKYLYPNLVTALCAHFISRMLENLVHSMVMLYV